MSKRALILGISGQDGSYLAELLLSKGYSVHGVIRRSSSLNTSRIDHIFDDLHLMHGDVTDAISMVKAIQKSQPDEIYNLAAQSHVAVSYESAVYTSMVDMMGPLHILEAMKLLGCNARFYQASTSELFGFSPGPQNEQTPFSPCSPYAAAKLAAYWTTCNYRDAYGMHASNGILFNHESPRRGETFVTRKICKGVARYVMGAAHGNSFQPIVLGNLNAKRDWGHARDYVFAMWAMLQCSSPGDYVIATGETHTVREFVDIAFQKAGVPVGWRGEGLEERLVHTETGEVLVHLSQKYLRPLEVPLLLGDASKARQMLGWRSLVAFEDLVEEMLLAELCG